MYKKSRGLVAPENLPPTDRAAYFHGLRVHLQVLKWSSLNEELEEKYGFEPNHWGWFIRKNKLIPIMTDMDIAPPSIKNVIRCNCRNDKQNPCSTKSCTCRKYGIKCFESCGNCRDEDCTNYNVSNIIRAHNNFKLFLVSL